ncbi:unnamed protein product [Didymodactylos carnosus]|uniref:Putative auto-transporter adhesin head GIN domain-containing protein n=1 Tax=Didymodactylos carnosus TaxID=1234261 RepID=A0A814A287_9BILA|nr:unnamed protein product [Didymodactylos carnosus]CAF1416649.1 unnamed protein product [Didymodactylos carnosus]CAF3688247.1 unnamed protein product [Didymodactylos carnosus]CAF4218781.1 unnamed protein product [Didymodactylos carnosus]
MISVYLVLIISALTTLKCNQSKIDTNNNIVRQSYPLNDNVTFNHIVVNSFINYQLIQDDINSVEIETHKSVHNCCIHVEVTQKHILLINLNRTVHNYPKINAYIKFKSLKQLDAIGTGHVQSMTIIKQQQDKFILNKQGTGNVNLILEVNKLQAFISGTGHVKLNGHVRIEARIRQSGTTTLDARHCLMNKISIISNGVTSAHIVGKNEINISVDGISNVYYRGPLNKQKKSNFLAKIQPF